MTTPAKFLTLPIRRLAAYSSAPSAFANMVVRPEDAAAAAQVAGDGKKICAVSRVIYGLSSEEIITRVTRAELSSRFLPACSGGSFGVAPFASIWGPSWRAAYKSKCHHTPVDASSSTAPTPTVVVAVDFGGLSPRVGLPSVSSVADDGKSAAPQHFIDWVAMQDPFNRMRCVVGASLAAVTVGAKKVVIALPPSYFDALGPLLTQATVGYRGLNPKLPADLVYEVVAGSPSCPLLNSTGHEVLRGTAVDYAFVPHVCYAGADAFRSVHAKGSATARHGGVVVMGVTPAAAATVGEASFPAVPVVGEFPVGTLLWDALSEAAAVAAAAAPGASPPRFPAGLRLGWTRDLSAEHVALLSADPAQVALTMSGIGGVPTGANLICAIIGKK